MSNVTVYLLGGGKLSFLLNTEDTANLINAWKDSTNCHRCIKVMPRESDTIFHLDLQRITAIEEQVRKNYYG